MTTDATERSVTHATFTLDRVYKSVPARVFAAWANNDAKSQWFTGGSEWKERERTLDFRVGGQERLVGEWLAERTAPVINPGAITQYDARYEEIVPDARIIFTYQMRLNGRSISVSLATVQFKPEGTGTRLIFTEQLTCLDGYDDPNARSREHGTNAHLDRLEAYLEGRAAG
jgi:uncharacterized protein YndB with AHSA1/START domain